MEDLGEENEMNTSAAKELKDQTFGMPQDGMLSHSSIMDISMGETQRFKGQFANALVPIPEDGEPMDNQP